MSASNAVARVTESAAASLPSTGERFIPGLGGMIELEHRHRYLFARQACSGKVVLDIACGEGYGSSALAQVAAEVVGVDIAAEAVAHARKHYGGSNLTFKVGDCAAIPMDDASVDVVVSFETIEHHDRHEEMMSEIRRVLRPGGLLVISSPERFEYSERTGTRNEFHVRELYRDEFIELVGRHFGRVDLYDQKVIFGSAILAEVHATRAVSTHADALHERSRGLVRPLFLIAVASDAEIPAFDTGVFEQALADSSEWKWWLDTVHQRDARILALDAEVDALQARLHDQQQRAVAETESERRYQGLVTEHAALDARRLAVQNSLQEAVAESGRLQARVIDLQDALVSERAQFADRHAERIVALQEQAEQRESQLRAEADGRVERLESAHTARLQALQERLIALQDELALQHDAMARRLADQAGELQRGFVEREAHLVTAAALRERDLQDELTARIAAIEQEGAERTGEIDRQLAAERAALANVRQRLSELGTVLERRGGELGEAMASIERAAEEQAGLRLQMADETTRRADAEAQIVLLRDELGPLHHYAAKLQWVLSVAQHSLDKREAEVAELRRAIEVHEGLTAALHRSSSWRLTAPLRALKSGFRFLGRLPGRAARRASALAGIDDRSGAVADEPVDQIVGRQIDAATAPDDAQTGPQFASSDVPAADVPAPSVPHDASLVDGAHGDFEPIAQLLEEVTVMTEPATLQPTYSAAGAPLWVADGSHEWEDLPQLRARIAAAEASRLRAVDPERPALLSLAGQDMRSIATALSFGPSDKPLVTILIPVFNKIELTLECLLSIANARTEVPYEIVVADDASTDETAEILALVRHIRIHRNATNLHFLRNCNASLSMARGQHVVFLNNDVQVQNWWLDEMLLAFGQFPRVGAVGPKILYPSGHLQEAGVAFNVDMTVDMVGLDDDPHLPRYNYPRRVDYCSGACLMVSTKLLAELGGFCDDFAPAYCEDGDLCLRIRERGLFVYYVPGATVVHRLSATTAADSLDAKRRLVGGNLVTFASKWQDVVEREADVRTIAFYLPQYYPFPENDLWWGKGFTEWTNVTKAQPNFVGHYQPHLPADLGYYDLRVAQVMEEQASLARRYGLGGFCFYYYWFAGKRLLDRPIERLLETGSPAFPFCLCWANENWTRRWDGQESQVLMAQSHTAADDEAVIRDLIRFFRSPHYIRIDGRPLLVVYRVTLFPDFARTAALWRDVCRTEGIGEIYLTMVESFELVAADTHPSHFGCDATVEFPPQGLAEAIQPSGELVNPDFVGTSVDYRTLALRYCSRPSPAYTRFRGAMPGWDNTPRRQNHSYCIEHATPGSFQAWLEHIVEDARRQHFGDERIVFINAWNEWAEGAHLEPDRRFGHTYLEALRNAKDHRSLIRRNRYAL